jgi:predicted metal-dependent peptidase
MKDKIDIPIPDSDKSITLDMSQAYTKKAIHPKIMESIERMLIQYGLGYYAEFMGFISFLETNRIPTAGVSVGLRISYYHNKEFFDNLDILEVNFVNLHEIFHLLFDHPARTKSGGFDHKMANYAQDMIINEIIISTFSDKIIKVPDIGIMRMPEEYDQEHIFEILYYWLLDKKKEYDKWKQDNKDKDEDEKEECPVSDQLEKIFENYDADGNSMDIGQFDSHMEDNGIPEEIRKQVIQDIKNNLSNRGLETAEITSTLNKLIKSKKNYLKMLRKQFASIKGTSKHRSYKRPNRHGFKGVKGTIRLNDELTCIMDTSGSMHGHFEKILSYMLHGDQVVNLVQIDTSVKNHKVIKKKRDFQNVDIYGGGGTVLQPAVDYVKADKKLRQLNLVILTDGYTDSLNLNGIPQTLIITCGQEVPIDSGKEISQVIIEE